MPAYGSQRRSPFRFQPSSWCPSWRLPVVPLPDTVCATLIGRGEAMEQILIRTCTRQDIDAVIGLERQWEQEGIAYGDFNPLRREAYVAILERFPAYFLVAEHDGQLVGYMHASADLDKRVEVIPAHEPYVEIEDLYVHPDFRNQDIGGQLLERLFEIAQHEGI